MRLCVRTGFGRIARGGRGTQVPRFNPFRPDEMHNNNPHVMVVEDDPVVRTMLTSYLARQGFDVSALEDGDAVHAALAQRAADVVLLDINLPGKDGLELTRELRGGSSDVGIILISARTKSVDRVIGLEVGADDYIGKPFNLREVVARVNALLRRKRPAAPADEASPVFAFAGWKLYPSSHRLVAPEGGDVHLTRAEFDMLACFLRNAGNVLNREQLLDAINSTDSGPFDRTIDVLVSRLRRKMEKDPRQPKLFVTVYGVGYRFEGVVARS